MVDTATGGGGGGGDDEAEAVGDNRGGREGGVEEGVRSEERVGCRGSMGGGVA